MILSDTEILRAIEAGAIVIDPFDITQLGGNSYDVRLGPMLMSPAVRELDAAQETAAWHTHQISALGFVLKPGTFYLASTVEYTESNVVADHVGRGLPWGDWRLVPYLDGKSSVGRLGIQIHATAGRGDVGFRNHWTLEISVSVPVRVYAGMPIGQLTWHRVAGNVKRVYGERESSAYGALPRDPNPQPSRMHLQPWALRARELARIETERRRSCTCTIAWLAEQHVKLPEVGSDAHRHQASCPLAQMSLLGSVP